MSAVLPQPSGRNSGSLMLGHNPAPACENAPTQVVGDDAHLRARATDPATSHAAAKRAALFAKGHASRILKALEELGSATAKEIGAHTGMTVVQIDRRRVELIRAGKVRILTINGLPMGDGGIALERDGFDVMGRTS